MVLEKHIFHMAKSAPNISNNAWYSGSFSTHYCVPFILSLQSKIHGFQHLKLLNLEDDFISDCSIILDSLSSLSQ